MGLANEKFRPPRMAFRRCTKFSSTRPSTSPWWLFWAAPWRAACITLSPQRKKKQASTAHLIIEGLLGVMIAIVVGVMVKTSFPGFPLDIRDTQAGAFSLAFFGGVGGVPFLHALAAKMGFVGCVAAVPENKPA